MKEILIFGGTGAMGVPLVQELSRTCRVTVTSRSPRPSQGNVEYLRGNAHRRDFLLQTLGLRHWDTVIDFLSRPSDELRSFLPHLLQSTDQYVFISSARVYAECEGLITEDSPRLLEASPDKAYLRTNEYALAKAREEDLLRHSGHTNWTIVRPSITYNTHRLQLGVLELENWLYRALHGRSIVFSHDIADKLTTNTLGTDVSHGIASLVGRPEALGQTFHITQPRALTWAQILEVYQQVLTRHLGHPVPVVMTRLSTKLLFPGCQYQVRYCRYFHRRFSNARIDKFCPTGQFTAPREGLARCLEEFLQHPKYRGVNWAMEGVNDRVAGEHTPLSEIPGLPRRLLYLLHRHLPSSLIPVLHHVIGFALRIRRKALFKS